MFKKLKDKLKGWAKKVSEESPEKEVIEEIIEQPVVNPTKGKKPKLEEPIETPTPSKKEIKKQKREEKKAEKKEKKKEKLEEKEVTLEQPEPDIEKLQEEIKEHKEKKKKLFSKHTIISEKDFEEHSEDLEMILIENNVALEVAEKIIQDLKIELVGKEIPKKGLEEEINKTMTEIIKDILVEPFDIMKEIKEKKPYVILFCGINGAGKTTTIAKFGQMLKDKGLTSVMGAGDTFRAASIEQLKKHGDKLGIKVIAQEYGSDPAAVGFDTVKYA